MNQVKTEAQKIVWPTSKETMQTTLMVILMASALGLFFFALDSGFSGIVQWLLSFVAKG